MPRKVTLAELIRAGLVAPNVGAVPSDPYATAREGYAMATEPIPAAQPALDWLGNVPVVGSALRFGGDMMAPSYADLLTAGMSRVGRVLSGGADTLADLARLTGYHGTPHTLPPTPNNPLGEFDASKIGTGEGGQAYGYGIYLAENPMVAKTYLPPRQAGMYPNYGSMEFDLPEPLVKEIQGIAPPANTPADFKDGFETVLNAYTMKAGDSYQPLDVVKRRAVEDAWRTADDEQAFQAGVQAAVDRLQPLFKKTYQEGSLYTVDIPDDMIGKMLDWDKPLSEQPEAVRKALLADPKISAEAQRLNEQRIALNKQSPRRLTHPVIGKLANNEITPESLKGEAIYTLLAKGGNQAEASNYLRSLGIPGIKYLDAGSRSAATAPTRNFVVFPGEERNVKILSRE